MGTILLGNKKHAEQYKTGSACFNSSNQLKISEKDKQHHLKYKLFISSAVNCLRYKRTSSI